MGSKGDIGDYKEQKGDMHERLLRQGRRKETWDRRHEKQVTYIQRYTYTSLLCCDGLYEPKIITVIENW